MRDLINLIEATIGGVPEDIVERYSYGDCMWLALALNKRFGWPIFAQMEDGHIAHAYCKMPDGRECDVLGPQDQVDIWTTDVQPWTPEELLQEIEDHGSPRATAKFAHANDVIDLYIAPKL